MTTLTVYRIEYLSVDGNTYGPYSANWGTKYNPTISAVTNKFRKASHIFPEPHDDGIKTHVMHNNIFGVLRATYIFDMAPRWMVDELIEAGFTISLYKISTDKGCVGGKQAMWTRGNETLIKHLTVEECLDIMDEEIDSGLIW